MNIVMEYGTSPAELSTQVWDVSFYGIAVDERSEQAVAFANENSHNSYCLSYMASKGKVHIDFEDQTIWADDILETLISLGITEKSKVILESSSLGVAELLLLIQSLKDIGCLSFDVLYLEPTHYLNQTIEFTERRQFDLSTSFKGYIAIPGHALSFDSYDKAVVLCGYESDRLGRAFDEIDLQGKNCQLVFGMPPYIVGWDMNSYANHLPIIESFNIPSEFYYAGAANPLSVYRVLEKVYGGLEEDQKLFILPLGTKPMSIGACLFKVANNYGNVSILYDHPVRKKGRSKEVSKWNLYRIDL